MQNSWGTKAGTAGVEGKRKVISKRDCCTGKLIYEMVRKGIIIHLNPSIP